MSLVDGVVHLFAVVVVFGLVARASLKLHENPDRTHQKLVPDWERHSTSAVGLPLTLVGLSTMVDGPLAVPYNPLMIALPGIVLLVYPDFTPSSL
jgi:hypothetical protein